MTDKVPDKQVPELQHQQQTENVPTPPRPSRSPVRRRDVGPVGLHPPPRPRPSHVPPRGPPKHVASRAAPPGGDLRFLVDPHKILEICPASLPHPYQRNSPSPSPRGRIEPLPDYRTATESDTSSGVTTRRTHPSLRDEHWARRPEPRRRMTRGDGAVQGTPSYGSLSVNMSGAEGSALPSGPGSSSTAGGSPGGSSGLTTGRLERNSKQFNWLKQEREKMGRESGSRAASTRKDAILGVIAAVDKR